MQRWTIDLDTDAIKKLMDEYADYLVRNYERIQQEATGLLLDQLEALVSRWRGPDLRAEGRLPGRDLSLGRFVVSATLGTLPGTRYPLGAIPARVLRIGKVPEMARAAHVYLRDLAVTITNPNTANSAAGTLEVLYTDPMAVDHTVAVGDFQVSGGATVTLLYAPGLRLLATGPIDVDTPSDLGTVTALLVATDGNPVSVAVRGNYGILYEVPA